MSGGCEKYCTWLALQNELVDWMNNDAAWWELGILAVVIAIAMRPFYKIIGL